MPEIADIKKVHLAQAEENPKSRKWKREVNQVPAALPMVKEKRNLIEKKSNQHQIQDQGPEAHRERINNLRSIYKWSHTHLVQPNCIFNPIIMPSFKWFHHLFSFLLIF